MDALVALLVFLIRMLTYFPSKPNPELSIQVSHYLPRFSMMDRQGIEADVGGYMGCFFPRSTFQAIIELQHLSTGLGLLFSQKEIRVKSFLASLVGHCISSPCVDGIMGEKDKNSKLSLLLSLVGFTNVVDSCVGVYWTHHFDQIYFYQRYEKSR
jgi:hypothetical protein